MSEKEPSTTRLALTFVAAFLFWVASAIWFVADAQNTQCANRPNGDSTNACANTRFVQTAVPLLAITGLTGDGTATGPGNVALTLATVNGTPGTFGSATSCITATVNAKGLVTAISAAACTPSLVVGTTVITSGTTMGVLYNNAGVLGNTAAGTAGYMFGGNGASAPSFQAFTQPLTGGAARTWQAKAQEVVSLKDFGTGACTGGGDDSTILQAAIDGLPSTGGTILIPASGVNCVFASTITASKNNVTIAGQSPVDDSTAASSLVYSGTSARVFDLRDSVGWTFKNLSITITNAAFNGTIIDCGGTNPGVTVSSYCTLDTITFNGNQSGGATATCFNASEAIEFIVDKVNFNGCTTGIRGQQTLGQSTVGKITNSQFFQTKTMPISDCGESWSIIGNTFEQLATSSNAAAISITAARPCKNIVIQGNWFGDANTTGTWIALSANGASIVGNRIANGAVGIAMDGGTGYSISNNNMENTTAFSCANSPTGGYIGPNTYTSVTTYVSGTCVLFNIDGLSGTAMVTSRAWVNATSGSITQAPVTGALGTITHTLPAQSGTYAVAATQPAAVSSTGTITVLPKFGLINHSLAVSVNASALTISLKDNAGSDPSATSPVIGNFRNVTGTTGSWTQLSVTSALSLTVSSGSTLGTTSATAFRLWVVLFNDGGTARLGVINCTDSTGVHPLNEGVPASSTAEGGAGAADSAAVIYTGTAVASKSFLIVGYVEWSTSGVATAGTWTTTNVNYIQSFGPGIKKPGDVVQAARGVTTSATTTSSISYVTTGANHTITLTSAANPVQWSFSGLSSTTVPTVVTPLIQMHRASGGSAACTTTIGPVAFQTNQNNSVGVQAWWLVSYTDLDVGANISGQVTYTACVKASTANNVIFPEVTNGVRGVVTLQEIMG